MVSPHHSNVVIFTVSHKPINFFHNFGKALFRFYNEMSFCLFTRALYSRACGEISMILIWVKTFHAVCMLFTNKRKNTAFTKHECSFLSGQTYFTYEKKRRSISGLDEVDSGIAQESSFRIL
ncbi:hypothetical protein CHS0354_021224 [Potamilus streckersoni]|uniref:Uncharacterized protein n=1 Tax=Potamilus streckersoni TaxID=2493646 RepID=A0AAE0SSK0_9BIVA|nr:hypothetical protein CHS0354_021224 [Potamilus streckersoni]